MNLTLSIPIESTSEMNLENHHYIFHKERKESFHPFSSYLGTELLEEGKQQDQEAPNQCSHLRRSCLALFRAGKRDQQFRRSQQHRTQGWSTISSFLATRCPICHSQLLCLPTSLSKIPCSLANCINNWSSAQYQKIVQHTGTRSSLSRIRTFHKVFQN